MNATTPDENHIAVNLADGSYVLIEETEAKKKVWESFFRIVHCDTREIVKLTASCRGFAACRDCGHICRLGLRGGTKELENHFGICSRTVTVDDAAIRY